MPCPAGCTEEASQNYGGDACKWLMSAYILAGLAMMLNIRLSYSSAPYALIRFRLPENLFSVFVRRMASALELWCLPSMLLGNIMDLIQKLFDDGAELRAIKVKHTQLQTKANTLKITAEAGAGQVNATAGTLRDNAGTLNGAADALSKFGDLTALKEKAEALANAAGKQGTSDDKDSLYYHANQLQSNPNDHDNAIAVMDAFNKVKTAYNKLAEHSTYSTKLESAKAKEATPSSPLEPDERKVNAVDDAWKKVESDFQTLCKALFKQYSENVDTQATELQKGPSVATARLFKKEYDKFGKIYNPIPDENKTYVKTQWDALKDVIVGEMKRWKFYWIIVPSIVSQWLNFLTYVILLVVYLIGGDKGRLTTFYWVIAISGVVFGINMTLVYSVDFYYIPVYIAGENSFPILTSFIHYLATLMFGNRRKYNSDFILVEIDIFVAIIISFVAAVVWTVGYVCELGGEFKDMKHIHAHGFDGNPNGFQISPFLMIVVGMGLVYAIYPGIAPGMIVPFYLIDKIEMVLLVMTIFPPVIIAILRIHKKSWSPQHNFGSWGKWKTYSTPWDPDTTVHAWIWHFFDILMVIKISLAAIFIYSLHYRGSSISRSIINQPKMSTFLSITFYMCHEILLAVGFSGFIGNDGGDWILIPQYIGALFMIFLAFYSEGYIIEYKSHDPAHWPTTGMTPWNAFCYWAKRSSKITIHNLK